MDYKEKYEKALGKVQEILSSEQDNINKSSLQNIFTELKESEGERVKRLLYSITKKMGGHLRDIFTEEEYQCFDALSFAWLKNQDKCNSIDVDEMVSKYSQTKDGAWGLPVNCQIKAYRQGINDVLNLVEVKK